ncbi:MAG: hydrogenase nickel incorporation protein HypB [Gemmatimonadota bacterium]
MIDACRQRMARNEKLAQEVRHRLGQKGITAFDLVASPGSGKGLLLERTLRDLGRRVRLAVINGDVQTRDDADRLAACQGQIVQAMTPSGACHMEAEQVLAGLDALDLDRTDLLLIANISNLISPPYWNLGETAKIVVYSVTEGEDKPIKYPRMFRTARYGVLNKVDLLPHLSFNKGRALAYARLVNPDLRVFETSALTGQGLVEWYAFLLEQVHTATSSSSSADIPADR